MRNTEWKPIPNYEGLYWVSSDGQVKNRHERILKPSLKPTVGIKTQYFTIVLYKDKKTKCRPIHQLVILAFVGDRPESLTVSHLNANSLDNRIENLVYETMEENMKRSPRRGALKK